MIQSNQSFWFLIRSIFSPSKILTTIARLSYKSYSKYYQKFTLDNAFKWLRSKKILLCPKASITFSSILMPFFVIKDLVILSPGSEPSVSFTLTSHPLCCPFARAASNLSYLLVKSWFTFLKLHSASIEKASFGWR